MDVALILRLADKVIRFAADMLDESYRPGGAPVNPTPPARCSRCNAEPWIVTWGAIRVGQQLDGFYYLATAGGPHLLVCGECWQKATDGAIAYHPGANSA